MQPKVLLVDDNITVIKIIRNFLEIEGFEVFSTNESTLALNKAREVMPDIILLDIVMPKPDGFEICKLLKEDRYLNEIPVIILTAETDSRDLKIAMESGAIDYIRKPADQTELIARVRSAYRIKQYQDKLKEIASRDGLTGLYNHAALIDRFMKEYEKQAQKGGIIAFIMLDIDNFKKINDTYGHSAGDTILMEVACILSWSVNSTAIVSRYGGEEFSIVITDMPSQSVFGICEEIRKSIEEYRFVIEDGLTVNVTVSIGFYNAAATDGADCKAIIKKADEALYSAKRNGRNRVVETGV